MALSAPDRVMLSPTFNSTVPLLLSSAASTLTGSMPITMAKVSSRANPLFLALANIKIFLPSSESF